MSKSHAGSILVVDDDAAVRRLLRRFLEGEDFEVEEAENGAGFRDKIGAREYDLVLLDISLGGESGFDLLRETREQLSAPVIFISGKGDVIDRVLGLELGADDYITKPFELREVLARIRTVLRRASRAAPAAPAPAGEGAPAEGALRFAGWRFDPVRRQLTSPEGEPVELTTGEFNLLAAFLAAPNRPLTRDQLMDRLKGVDWTPLDRSIDAQVSRLRKKIDAGRQGASLIKSVRGVGYVFAVQVEPG